MTRIKKKVIPKKVITFKVSEEYEKKMVKYANKNFDGNVSELIREGLALSMGKKG